MEKARLRKGDKVYRFIQEEDECVIIGEWEKYRGVTLCILSASGDKDWGNAYYKKLVSEGYRRVEA